MRGLDTDAALYAIAGATLAYPPLRAAETITLLGGDVAWFWPVGPLLGGFVAGYATEGGPRRGLVTGAWTTLYVLCLLVVFSLAALTRPTLAVGFDYWLHGVPEIGSPTPAETDVYVEATVVARSFLPAVFWTLLLTVPSGVVGGLVRERRGGG